MRQAKNGNLLIIGILFAAGIFIVDIYTPLGVADAISYVALVLLTLWSSRKSHTIIAASAGTVLTILGMIASPPGEIASIFVANRALALIGIWSAAFVILRFKKSEAESRKMRDSLNALFTYATEGIIISDDLGKIQMVNPEAEKQFGYEKSELMGKSIDVLVPDHLAKKHSRYREQFFEKPKSRAMGNGMELWGRRKNGSEFPLEISLSSYMLDGTHFVVAFIINITERKKQEEALKQTHEELKQYAFVLKETNAELENFAYISSHDLQEPLRKIQSFGDRLQTKDAAVMSEEGKDYLARMMNASVRMQKLINDLLGFSRLTSHSQSYSKIDLNQVATEVMSDLEVSIAKNNVKIQVDVLREVMGEPTQMRQLFQNLIANAIKFKKDKEDPVIHISSRDITIEERSFTEIRFEDNGIGFDEKYSDKIFSIFQRLDGRKYEGSGIGLAICKKIALRHGGTITASSTPGKGS
ncbi:MAG TPA: PAS domain S-box protein, partial [Bacteroidia bacterium]|nr:PAS domain S-box protein [Bacteroidia bacterium]